MIDMRKPRERRRGETNGSFNWWAVFDALVVLAIALAMTYTGFMLGRHYESVSRQDTVNPVVIWQDYKASRIQGNH